MANSVQRGKATRAGKASAMAEKKEPLKRTRKASGVRKTKRMLQDENLCRLVSPTDVKNSVILDPIPPELFHQLENMPTQDDFFEAVAFLQNNDGKSMDVDKLFPRRERIAAIEMELIRTGTDKPKGFNSSNSSASWKFSVKQKYEYFPEPTLHPKTNKPVNGLYFKANSKQIQAIESGKTEFHPRPISLEESYNLMVRYHYGKNGKHQARDDMFHAMIKDLGCSFSKNMIKALLSHCPQCKHRYSDANEVLNKESVSGSGSSRNSVTANQSQEPFHPQPFYPQPFYPQPFYPQPLYPDTLPPQIENQQDANYQDQGNVLLQGINYPDQVNVPSQIEHQQDFYNPDQVDGLQQVVYQQEINNPDQALNDLGSHQGQNLGDAEQGPFLQESQELVGASNDASYTDLLNAPLGLFETIVSFSPGQIVPNPTDSDRVEINLAEHRLPSQPGTDLQFDQRLISLYEDRSWQFVPQPIHEYYQR
ncbi:hypothetical protein B7494_g5023 [Chlorociboria aeruginascens]|nr:hypothetical protein B7494_g5023 [Chlorociboria aeruginascens]